MPLPRAPKNRDEQSDKFDKNEVHIFGEYAFLATLLIHLGPIKFILPDSFANLGKIDIQH
jgi:hypothetical protein